MKYLTGKMARLHNISKQTLIYYDKIGLFEPFTTSGENGYRYYTLDQFVQLDLILLLKKLGMTLKEIQNYQNQKSLTERIAILESKKGIINRKIEEMNSTNTHLESTIATLKSCLNNKALEIGIKHIQKRNIIREEIGFPNDRQALESSIEIFFDKNHKRFDICLNEMMVWIQPVSCDEIKFTSIGFEVKEDLHEILPSGLFGYIYHRGGPDGINESYDKLVGHIEASDYRVAGESIAKMVLGSLATSSQNEYIVEIQIPVQPA